MNKNYALVETGEATDDSVSYFGFNPNSWWEDENFSALTGMAYTDTFVSNQFRFVRKSENNGAGWSVGDTMNIKTATSYGLAVADNDDFELLGLGAAAL